MLNTCTAPAMSVEHPLVSAHHLEALAVGPVKPARVDAGMVAGKDTAGTARAGDHARPMTNWILM